MKRPSYKSTCFITIKPSQNVLAHLATKNTVTKNLHKLQFKQTAYLCRKTARITSHLLSYRINYHLCPSATPNSINFFISPFASVFLGAGTSFVCTPCVCVCECLAFLNVLRILTDFLVNFIGGICEACRCL